MTPSLRYGSLYAMLKFYADKFVMLSATLARLQNLATPEIKAEEFTGMRAYVGSIQEDLRSMGLRHSAKKAKQLSDDEWIPGFRAGVSALEDLIRSELEDGNFLYLTEEESRFFAPPEPLFGKDFETKFPSALYELDEAGKCLGLGRDTACAFHLMRITEIGLEAMRQSLQIPDPIKDAERNWNAILRKLKSAIDDRIQHQKPAPFRGNDKDLFSEMYALLDAVRIAWRNNTMHVESKYTNEEAQTLLVVVRGFMKKIASRMDEKGLPLA